MSDYAYIRARVMRLLETDISKNDFIREIENSIGVVGSATRECDHIIKQMTDTEFRMLVMRILPKLRKKLTVPAGVA